MDNCSEKALGIVLTSLLVKNIFFASETIALFKSYINGLVILIVLAMFMWRIKTIVKRRGKTFLIVGYVSMIYMLCQLILFENNTNYFLSAMPRIAFYGIIPFLIAMTVEDFDYLMVVLRKCGYVIVCASLLTVALLYQEGGLQSEYSMSFGSSVVVGSIVLEHYLLKERKWFDIILFSGSILCILLGGSRGPFLGVIAYYILYLCFISDRRTLNSRIRDLAIIATGVLFFFYYDFILESLYYFLENYGIRSRTLLLFIGGRIGQDSGRSYVYKICFELIDKHPITGIGYDGLKGQGYADYTPHNTYLEFLLYNGILIGGILIVVLVSLWLQGIFKNRKTSINYLCLVFFSLYVPRSFIGAGGIEKIDFWLLLAFSIMSVEAYRSRCRKEKEQSNIKDWCSFYREMQRNS